MDSFLPNYNDPIVSILMLLGVIFIVSVLSYAYSIWQQEQRAKELLGFLKNFDSKECSLDTETMPFDNSMKKPLFLLAIAYQKSGDYSKSINLYLYLLKHTKDVSLLSNLALAYLKAGFLQRSSDIYLEILSKSPRDKEALYQLEFIHEKLNDFESSLDALEVLEAQGENVDALKLNLKYQEISKAFIDNNQKFIKIVDLLKEAKENSPFLVRKLFKLTPKEAWHYYKDEYFDILIDILDKLKKEDIDLDIINKNILLKELYFTKGYLENCKQSSNNFALNLLASSKKASLDGAELKFMYLCNRCKNSYPLPFFRCPNCHRAFSAKIEVTVGKANAKTDYSLQ